MIVFIDPLMTLLPKASQLSHGASKPKGFKAGRTHGKDTGAVDTPFGTVTPKRCGGNSNIPFQDMLNGAVLYTPDGRQYGFTDMADLNVGISTQPFLTAVPSPTSGSFFTTAVSSPGNWDLANATPTTRANMFAVSASHCLPSAAALVHVLKLFRSTSMSGTLRIPSSLSSPS